VGADPVVSSAGPHYGEEAPLVGFGGSGTIFLANCNLACVFCQNYDISHQGAGSPASPATVAHTMLALQGRGCHNINFVTPTHVVPQLLEAIALAAEQGLGVPLVYNCGGYESIDTLRLLDGVIDIFMPDLKYTDAEVGQRLSGIPDYPQVAMAALKEMHHQVGDLVCEERGIAQRGMIIRHLVLPNDLAGTRDAARFIARELSPDAYVNIMAQYRPCFRARDYPEIARPLHRAEFADAMRMAREEGLRRFD
jgi:putative pyruvate formate lyase activating enzyme